MCVFLSRHQEAFPFTIEASPSPSFFADLEVLDTCGNASFALSRLLAAAAEGGILRDPAEKVRTSRHSGPTWTFKTGESRPQDTRQKQLLRCSGGGEEDEEVFGGEEGKGTEELSITLIGKRGGREGKGWEEVFRPQVS